MRPAARNPAALSFLIAFALTAMHAAAQELTFPENSGVRRQLADAIRAPLFEAVSARTQLVEERGSGIEVQFRVVTQGDDFYLLFINRQDGGFAIENEGSWVIKRSLRDGSFLQAKVFLDGDPNSYVRLFPRGERTRMDLYLYGYPAYRDIVVPIEFDRLLTDPFSQIIDATRESVDWRLVLPRQPLPEDAVVEGMVSVLRSRLPLPDHDDGAMDSGGKLVSIRTLQVLNQGGLNCSGFAKWIVDGLYYPRTGRLLSIEALKEKRVELPVSAKGLRAQGLEPYFGLDWTRNLAMAIERLSDPGVGPDHGEVRAVPFLRFVPDEGYPLADLKFILYALAMRRPGYFYLGSVNHELADFPGIREHSHVVTLFPYFASNGSFRVAVMERNLETGIDSLLRRYPGDSICLERIRASRNFDPPKID